MTLAHRLELIVSKRAVHIYAQHNIVIAIETRRAPSTRKIHLLRILDFVVRERRQVRSQKKSTNLMLSILDKWRNGQNRVVLMQTGS